MHIAPATASIRSYPGDFDSNYTEFWNTSRFGRIGMCPKLSRALMSFSENRFPLFRDML
jgi:hypothetical protein